MGSASGMAKKTVVLLGPSLDAVSGVSTHIKQLLSSDLADAFQLRHFQVGREGRKESRVARAGRMMFGPLVLARYLLVTRAAIVHLNTSINPRAFWRDLGYLLVARALRRKAVYQVHGGRPPREFAGNGAVALALMRWVLKLPQAIVLLAQSELIAYREFVPGARLELIPNAIAIVEPRAAAPRAQHGVPLQLAYVGRLIKEKGLFEILEAVSILRKRGIAVEATIAGAGPDAAAMQTLASHLAVGQFVRFVGPVFGEAKSRLWADADVFVFPTFHLERLPYALLESMAAGVVPITSAAGAIPDVMEDGVHGLLVPSRDPPALAAAIERLDGDRVMLQRMADACRTRIRERFTVGRMAREFHRLYETL
jgi:glycosyltransferase involved in cell wall biosynthesis